MKTKIYVIAFLLLAFNCKNEIKNEAEPEDVSIDKVSENNPDKAHNSQNSLDYNGTYKGVIPCADCEGIETSITINLDGTFSKTTKYLGKEENSSTENGTYTWNAEGSVITVLIGENYSQMYKVGENILFYLDQEGNRISGDLAENYKLVKVTKTYEEIENKKWILVELLGQKIDSKTNAFLLFNGEQSKVSGNNSCNTFSGSYELKGNEQISLGNLAVTQRACLDIKTGASFNDILNKVDNYTINDGKLNLNKAKMATLAKFKLQ